MNDDEKRWMQEVERAAEQGDGHLRRVLEDTIARNLHTMETQALAVEPTSELLQRMRTLMRFEHPRAELFYQLVIAHDFDAAIAMRDKATLVQGTPADRGDGELGLVMPFMRPDHPASGMSGDGE